MSKKIELGENDKLVTDFRRPAGYLTREAVLGEIKLYNRYYNLRYIFILLHILFQKRLYFFLSIFFFSTSYAGIPIYIEYKDLSKSSQILNSQYVEVSTYEYTVYS